MLKKEMADIVKLSRREITTLTIGILGIFSSCIFAYWLFTSDPYHKNIQSWDDQTAHVQQIENISDEIKDSLWKSKFNNYDPLLDYYCSTTIIKIASDLEFLTVGHCIPSNENSVKTVTLTHANGDYVEGKYIDCREYRESEREDNVAVCRIAVDSVPDSMRALPIDKIDPEAELKIDDEIWVAGYPGIINKDNDSKWYFDDGVVRWIGPLRDTGHSKNERACASAEVDGGISGGPVYREWQLVGVVSAMCDVNDSSGTVFTNSVSISDIPSNFWRFVDEFE